jgi:hypothetical protein
VAEDAKEAEAAEFPDPIDAAKHVYADLEVE